MASPPPQACLICPIVGSSPVVGQLISIAPHVNSSHVNAGFAMFAHDRCLKAGRGEVHYGSARAAVQAAKKTSPCCVCRAPKGALIKCTKSGCKRSFHYACAKVRVVLMCVMVPCQLRHDDMGCTKQGGAPGGVPS